MVTIGCALSNPSIKAALLTTDSQPIPAQLSPPTMNLWTVSSLTDNHWTTPILYTSSTNYTKALTEAMGEAVLTANPNNKPPPSHYTLILSPSTPKCWMLIDSVAALAYNP